MIPFLRMIALIAALLLGSAAVAERVALVLGNSIHVYAGHLANAENDAGVLRVIADATKTERKRPDSSVCRAEKPAGCQGDLQSRSDPDTCKRSVERGAPSAARKT